jgi:hypothetical protein
MMRRHDLISVQEQEKFELRLKPMYRYAQS